ncbi:MAG: hypothetical protein K9K38_05585 [Rhodoferax sp.]|nr:hypothetical protein [Rhodoferax sp.]MCF8208860.1 hypothetical protein [Rhodoferax sp.]
MKGITFWVTALRARLIRWQRAIGQLGHVEPRIQVKEDVTEKTRLGDELERYRDHLPRMQVG